MKTKIFVLVLLFVLVATLAFSGGKKEEVEATTAEGPQYGGTLTMWDWGSKAEPPHADAMGKGGGINHWLPLIQEKLTIGDIEKYGPRGTGDYPFYASAFIPPKYLKGNLLESWEVTPEKVVMHVRKGVMWAPNEDQKAWMPVRELTAEDIAADINIFRASVRAGTRFKGMIKDLYATDKYTVVAEFENYSSEFMYYIGTEDRAIISPPEMQTIAPGGPDVYENQVGTGPWMFEEYVVGSHMSYVKNPIYWGKAHIDGKEYQRPFIERVVQPIMPDVSTQMAALRTGKLDIISDVNSNQWDMLKRTAPDLQYAHYSDRGKDAEFNVTHEPFDDVNVRRAMMIGTDLRAFSKLFLSEWLPIDWFPMYYADPSVHIPVAEMPEENQVLYKHDPMLAKKMLADAGYPNGFKTSIIADISYPEEPGVAALLKDQWSKLGVELEIEPLDPAVKSARDDAMEFDMKMEGIEVANPANTVIRLGKTTGYNNSTGWSNPDYDALCWKIEKELDVEKKTQLVKEASLFLSREVLYIPLGAFGRGHYWWPWLKNYYGEKTNGDRELADVMSYVWIDQAMKKKMGH